MYSEKKRDWKTDRRVDSSTPHAYTRTRIARTDRTPDVVLLDPKAAPAGLASCARCGGIPLGRFLGAMPPDHCSVCWHRWGRGTPIADTQPGRIAL